MKRKKTFLMEIPLLHPVTLGSSQYVKPGLHLDASISISLLIRSLCANYGGRDISIK